MIHPATARAGADPEQALLSASPGGTFENSGAWLGTILGTLPIQQPEKPAWPALLRHLW